MIADIGAGQQSGLIRIKQQTDELSNTMRQMGTLEQQAGVERTTSSTRELTMLMRPLAQGTLSARNAMSLLGTQLGVSGIAIAGFGYLLYNQFSRLRQMAEQVRDIDTTARTLGIPGGALNNIVSQFEAMGLKREAAVNFATGFTRSLADLRRAGGTLERGLLQQARTKNEAMRAWLSRMTGFADRGQMEEAVNELVEGVNNAYQAELDRTGSTIMAADLRTELLRSFGVDAETFSAIRGRLRGMTEAEKDEWQRRQQISENYSQAYNRLATSISQYWTNTKTESMQQMAPLIREGDRLFQATSSVWGGGEGAAQPFKILLEGISSALKEINDLIDAIKAGMEQLGLAKTEGGPGWLSAVFKYQPSLAGLLRMVGQSPVGGGGGGQAQAPPTGQAPGNAVVQGGVNAPQTLPRMNAPEIPGRQAGGPVGGGEPYIVGEQGPELFVPERSGTIIPNSALGGEAGNRSLLDQWGGTAALWGTWGAAKGAALAGVPGAGAAAETIYGAGRAGQIGAAAAGREAAGAVGQLGLAYGAAAATGIPTPIWNFIFGALGRQKEAVRGALESGQAPGFFEAEQETASRAVNALRGLWGTVTGRQAGGPVTAGAEYVVGEGGPEIFMPEGGGGRRSSRELMEEVRLNTFAIESLDTSIIANTEAFQRFKEMMEPITGVGAREGGAAALQRWFGGGGAGGAAAVRGGGLAAGPAAFFGGTAGGAAAAATAAAAGAGGRVGGLGAFAGGGPGGTDTTGGAPYGSDVGAGTGPGSTGISPTPEDQLPSAGAPTPGGRLVKAARTTARRGALAPDEFNAHRSGIFGPADRTGANQTTIALSNGQRITVNKQVAGRFQGFLNELTARGYSWKSGGGHVYRQMRGGSSLSTHSWGTSIDINVPTNPFQPRRTHGAGPVKTDMPEEVEMIAWKHGLSWGARFGDPMHFEAMGPQAVAKTQKLLKERGYLAGEASAQVPQGAQQTGAGGGTPGTPGGQSGESRTAGLGAPPATGGGGAVNVAQGGNQAVDAKSLYNHLVERFRNSKLSGFVPADGRQFGITTGSPEEWARFAVALAYQESGMRARPPPEPNNKFGVTGTAGLYQFGPNDLARRGLGRDPTNVNAQITAMIGEIEKSKRAGAIRGARNTGGAAYFGSIRRPHETTKHLPKAQRVASEAQQQQVASRQFGGLLNAGQQYLVGERGPETFLPGGGAGLAQMIGGGGPGIFMPRSSGTMLPNIGGLAGMFGAGGGGGMPNIASMFGGGGAMPDVGSMFGGGGIASLLSGLLGSLSGGGRGAGVARGELDRSMGVEAIRNLITQASGMLRVNVNAPTGTSVSAAGEGLFNTTEVNRSRPMFG